MRSVRARWADDNPDVFRRLVRAHGRAAAYVEDEANRDEVARILSAPERIAVAPDVIRRTLDGRLKISPDGSYRSSDRYLLIGRTGAARPDPVQAAWLYEQMVRWGQALLSKENLTDAVATFRPDLYDEIFGGSDAALPASEPTDRVGAFTGPAFDPKDVAAHLEVWKIRRR